MVSVDTYDDIITCNGNINNTNNNSIMVIIIIVDIIVIRLYPS